MISITTETIAHYRIVGKTKSGRKAVLKWIERNGLTVDLDVWRDGSFKILASKLVNDGAVTRWRAAAKELNPS